MPGTATPSIYVTALVQRFKNKSTGCVPTLYSYPSSDWGLEPAPFPLLLPFCNVLPSSGTTLHVLLYSNILDITLTLSLNLPNFLGFILFKVVDYLQKKFEELGSPNKMKVSMGHGAKAWVSDFNHPHYMAGRKAMKTGTVAEWCKTNIGCWFFLAV